MSEQDWSDKDWMDPWQRNAVKEATETGQLSVWRSVIAVADKRIRDLEAQVKTARQEALEDGKERKMGSKKKTGIDLIREERKRQVEKLGWTAEHDDEHICGQMCDAAVCYALPGFLYFKRETENGGAEFSHVWPKFWGHPPKFTSDIDEKLRNLSKAGALIAAEIDRLMREQSEAGTRAKKRKGKR